MLLAFLTFYLLYRSSHNTNKSGRSAPDPPGPWGLPVIGNLAQLGKAPQRALTAMWGRYGDVYKIQLGSRPTVVINGLETCRQALVKQSEDFAGRPDFYTFNFIANGKSMGFSDYGPRWKLHRKIAQNALSMFINSADNPMEVNIQQEAEVLVAELLKAAAGSKTGVVNPHNEIFLSVGNIICALCFGKRYQRDDPDFVQLVKNNDEFMAFAGAGNPVDIMPWMRHFTKRSFEGFLKILRTMENFCLKKRQEHALTYDPAYMRDATDALLRASEEIDPEEKEKVGLTDEHILGTVQEMIGAGFDTIATTLQWAVLFMATHEDIKKKVQEEITAIIGTRQPCYKDYTDMPFTEAIIIETMRHSCIFPFALPHSTTRDTTLNGFFIPDKTLVFVNLFSITRDESKFPQPEVFNPMRFLTSDGQRLSKTTDLFLPFSAGRRKCPGELLGRMELFIFFVSLVQNCDFQCIPGVKYTLESKYGLTLKPQDFDVIITPRKKQ